jgi:glycerol-3-phosphate dehydrogenase
MRIPKRWASRNAPEPFPARAAANAMKDVNVVTEEAVPAIVVQAYEAANARMRVRVLNRMLRAVGPLALAVVAGGAFARYVTQARWSALTVSLSDATAVSSAQVYEIASYVQQSNPEVIRQIAAVLARDVPTMSALGATVGALLIGYLSKQPRTRSS